MIRKLTLLLLITLSVVSCRNNKKEDSASAQIENLRDSMNQVIGQKESEINDIMSTFSEIQKGFDEINQAESRVNLEKNNPERFSKKNIMENIEFINRTMRLNKERISRLQQQLKTSSFNAGKLKAMIESLNRQMDEKEQQITQLQEELKSKDMKIEEQGRQITSLSGDVANLTAQNEQKSQTLAHQDEEIHTAWYVFGTKRELKEQRILQNGNILKTSTFNKDYFTRIDIRVVKTIKLYSKSARLLTNHPSASYTLDRDAQKQYTLHITNPQQFWSISKYLVILVR